MLQRGRLESLFYRTKHKRKCYHSLQVVVFVRHKGGSLSVQYIVVFLKKNVREDTGEWGESIQGAQGRDCRRWSLTLCLRESSSSMREQNSSFYATLRRYRVVFCRAFKALRSLIERCLDFSSLLILNTWWWGSTR